MSRWPAPEPGRSGLRAEAKLAWRYLYDLAGGIERSVSVLAANVGAEQGTSDRSGRRALESLAEAGLVRIPDRFKGQLTVYLNDPAIVARARLASATNDCDQGELEFPPEIESLPQGAESAVEVLRLRPRSNPPAADNAQDPPADLAQDPPPVHRTSASARAIETSNITPNIRTVQNQNPRMLDVRPADLANAGGSCTRTAASPRSPMEERDWQRLTRQASQPPEREIPTIGAAIRLPTSDDRLAEVQRLSAWLRERIADPAFGTFPTETRTGLRPELMLLRIGWGIVNGRIPLSEINAIFICLNDIDRKGRLRLGRAAYFVGAVKRIFDARGVDWKRPDG